MVGHIQEAAFSLMVKIKAAEAKRACHFFSFPQIS